MLYGITAFKGNYSLSCKGRYLEKVFNDTLKECESYKFIRIVSKFGIAVLDMLKTADLKIGENYKNDLIENTRRQAVFYPKYMRTETKNDYSLTDAEKTVLKLVCDGLTNEEIAHLTDTAVRTVKFHLSNIYNKLNVKGRTGAINLCLENDII